MLNKLTDQQNKLVIVSCKTQFKSGKLGHCNLYLTWLL